MPSQTDMYFPIEDAEYEKQFIPDVEFIAIPSIWGHLAGVGLNPVDNEFLNAKIASFLSR
jgi:homoserine O-acetyltransferase